MLSQSAIEGLAEEYFSKPMHCFFRAYELRAYEQVKLDIRSPILDMGCGRGAFGQVLCRIKNLKRIELGMDIDLKMTALARQRDLYEMVCAADARAIPLKSGSCKFIVSNGAVFAINPGNDLVFREFSRVLEPGGQIAMTVPTPVVTDHLIPMVLFKRLGFSSFKALYAEKVLKRWGVAKLEPVKHWIQELEQSGFKVEEQAYYFSPQEAKYYSILAMRPFQIFSLLRYAPRAIRRAAIARTEKMIRSLSILSSADQTQWGFVLITARKS